jgi:hypothetical protein
MVDFSLFVAESRSLRLGELLKEGKRSILGLCESSETSNKAFKRMKLIAEKNPNSSMKDIIKPLKAYIIHLEIVVVTLSARKAHAKPASERGRCSFQEVGNGTVAMGE